MAPGCLSCHLLNGHLPKWLPVAMAVPKPCQAHTFKVWQPVSVEEEEGLKRQVKCPWYEHKVQTSTQVLAGSFPKSLTSTPELLSLREVLATQTSDPGKASEGLWGLDMKEGALPGTEGIPESKLTPGTLHHLPIPSSILGGLVVGASQPLPVHGPHLPAALRGERHFKPHTDICICL